MRRRSVAEETITRLIDDLDGSDATQKVLLGLNGEWRALDLSDKNHASLMKGIEKFWDAAMPVKGSAAPTRRRQSAGSAKAKADRGYDIAMLREWAAENKIPVPSRGRIAGSIVERFQADLSAGWQPKKAQ